MQPNEALKPKGSEIRVLPQVPKPEGKTVEKGGWAERMKTYVGDFARDIVTANKMAVDKFDGDSHRDSPLMRAARGGMTTLIGVGLDEALDNVLSRGIKQGEVWIGRQKLDLGKELVDHLAELGEKNPRLRYFIESASKNFITGLAYNTISYFSGYALPKAEPKHFLGSMVASATEAIGPKGQEGVKIFKNEPMPTDRMQAAKLLEREAAERKAAFANAPDPKVVAESARKEWLEKLESDQAQLRQDWEEAIIMGAPRKSLAEDLPRPLSRHDLRKERAKIKAAAIATGEKAKNLRHNLLVNAFKAQIGVDRLHSSLKYAAERSSDTHSNWKVEAQRFIKYANPATLLGLDWMIDGLITYKENLRKVRQVRKEKGIVGKSVEMPKKDEWHKGSAYRKDDRRWERQPYNKDKVYYGRGKAANIKAEEEALEKLI